MQNKSLYSVPTTSFELASEVLMNTQKAAEFLGLSAPTLERYRLTGTPAIPFIKFPGKRGPVRYRKSDLVAFLERSMRTSTSDGGSDASE